MTHGKNLNTFIGGSSDEHWSGEWGFIYAAAGSAIGLGNIWRFPYLAGRYGGASFILLYVVLAILLGFSLMLLELSLGRATRQGPVAAFHQICPNITRVGWLFLGVLLLTTIPLVVAGRLGAAMFALIATLVIWRRGWSALGIWYVFGGVLFLGTYSIIGGWTLNYLGRALTGGLAFPNLAAAKSAFAATCTSPSICLTSQIVFMLICLTVVVAGVKKGIERISYILLPLMIPVLVVLMIRGLTLDGAVQGLEYMFKPDFSKITGEALLAALGQVFLSLSLGLGITVTYGSYLTKKQNIPRMAATVVFLDTLVSLLCGIVVFTTAFSEGIVPDGGPGLVFETMPVVLFGFQDGLGMIWSILLFFLLAAAAVTSGIGTLEVAVAFAMREYGWSRLRSVVASAALITAIGAVCSFSVLDWNTLPGIKKVTEYLFVNANGSLFFFLDNLGGSFFLPIGCLMIVFFGLFAWNIRHASNEIGCGCSCWTRALIVPWIRGVGLTPEKCWIFSIKYLLPIGMIVILLHAAGWL